MSQDIYMQQQYQQHPHIQQQQQQQQQRFPPENIQSKKQ